MTSNIRSLVTTRHIYNTYTKCEPQLQFLDYSYDYSMNGLQKLLTYPNHNLLKSKYKNK